MCFEHVEYCERIASFGNRPSHSLQFKVRLRGFGFNAHSTIP
jgi:hypothetical protein